MAKKKYHIDASTYKRIKAFDFSEMNAWIERLYRAAFNDGIESVKITDADDVIKEISNVKGIGPKRLAAIKEAMERV